MEDGGECVNRAAGTHGPRPPHWQPELRANAFSLKVNCKHLCLCT
uniref:Eukaryotic translation initiation factor 2B, subunit alpha n=1 Tax=Mus musculus TaxID=10090 RepID=D6RI38_MOUSE